MSNLIRIEQLNLHVTKRKQQLTLVSDLSLAIQKGEVFALVGESGSGKSMTAKALTGMLPNNIEQQVETLTLGEHNLKTLSKKAWQNIRGEEIGIVFQDPMTSLNPTMKIGDQLTEIFVVKWRLKKQQAYEKSIALLEKVKITEPALRMKQYPHELSGGMRQRVLIAIAVALSPTFIVADEPTTALDVTTQKQILQLFKELKDEEERSILLITHDLGVVAEVADRVGVMYAGRIVEVGTVNELFDQPQHPYTKGLLRSLVTGETNRSLPLKSIAGTPPLPTENMKGCPFAARCDQAMSICLTQKPPRKVTDRHEVECWLTEKGDV